MSLRVESAVSFPSVEASRQLKTPPHRPRFQPPLTTPQIAWAQCIPNGPNSFICSGANTTPQLIGSNYYTVRTSPGFSIDAPTSAGAALALTGGGNIRYLDFANSSPTGDKRGR